MKILIVAHPDDEILWFNPSYFDQIYIAFLDRHDKPGIKEKRLNCILSHPFREKISIIALEESGYWKDRTRYKMHGYAKEKLLNALQSILEKERISEIYTHNEVGEYGHSDHILVNECVNSVFEKKCRIWMPYKFIFSTAQYQPRYVQKHDMKIDIDKFKFIRGIYLSHDSWTWNTEYQPGSVETYYRVN